VRRFLRESGHIDAYEGLSVKYVPGKPPVLFLFDENNVQVEKINLKPLTTEQIHELVQSKGFLFNPKVAQEL
jgi:hypothetical protein